MRLRWGIGIALLLSACSATGERVALGILTLGRSEDIRAERAREEQFFSECRDAGYTPFDCKLLLARLKNEAAIRSSLEARPAPDAADSTDCTYQTRHGLVAAAGPCTETEAREVREFNEGERRRQLDEIHDRVRRLEDRARIP